MQQSSLMIFCEACGLANKSEASHCSSCQHPLTPEPSEPIPTPIASIITTPPPAQIVPPRVLLAQDKQSAPTILSQSPECDFQPGSILAGRYQIQEKVGQGGFSTVYRAVDQQSRGKNSLVAIKRIQLNQLTSSQIIDATETFNREVAILQRLKDIPGIPAYYGHLADTQNWYLITQYIEGQTLETYLQNTPNGYLDEKEVIKLGIEITDILTPCISTLHRSFSVTSNPPISCLPLTTNSS
ncbi:protein kinase domain-containing protein [Ktedonospora formicarum]|uniref:Protein kinase domain-containing protein n=1 Tax=Ktedonospora formicarum TaxID=2778364 RepID=A0A8J3MWV2_9CHLR|nr:protein kinase [Ktedonospora formicarum]GHO49361.1 hypothetical protein KSX_75240 [Ktedonospora formicarum]